MVSVAAGSGHSLGLDDNRQVWAFGDNEAGQAGKDPEDTDEVEIQPGFFKRVVGQPEQVANLDDAVGIAGGGEHSLALDTGGQVWAFGDNLCGQLGSGSLGGSSHEPSPVVDPTAASGRLTGVEAIEAGRAHNLALKDDGTLWAWGSNSSGQLGNGTASGWCPDSQFYHPRDEVGQPVPTRVSIPTDVVAAAAGNDHSLALDAHGTVWAWGANGRGQLGLSEVQEGWLLSVNTPAPVKTLPEDAEVVDVAAGNQYSLALTADGRVLAWGDNQLGQLGDGTEGGRRAQPRAVTGPLGDQNADPKAVVVEAGRHHNLAATADGAVYGWGGNGNFNCSKTYGQAKPGGACPEPAPVEVGGLDGAATAVAGGEDHSLAAVLADSPPGAVAGTVTDAVTQEPVPNAEVTVTDSEANPVGQATTDSDGRYRIGKLAPGGYTVTADGADYEAKSKDSTVGVNQTTTTNFRLQPAPNAGGGSGAVAGTVIDAQSGDAVQDAHITARDAAGVVRGTATTDANGAYTVDGLAAGDYTVRAGAAGYESATEENVTVEEGQTTQQVDFALLPLPDSLDDVSTDEPGAITGTVRDADTDDPLTGVQVTADRARAQQPAGAAVTNSRGDYRINGLPPGDYTVTADTNGYQAANRDATVAAGRTTRRVDLWLQRVSDGDGDGSGKSPDDLHDESRDQDPTGGGTSVEGGPPADADGGVFVSGHNPLGGAAQRSPEEIREYNRSLNHAGAQRLVRQAVGYAALDESAAVILFVSGFLNHDDPEQGTEDGLRNAGFEQCQDDDNDGEPDSAPGPPGCYIPADFNGPDGAYGSPVSGNDEREDVQDLDEVDFGAYDVVMLDEVGPKNEITCDEIDKDQEQAVLENRADELIQYLNDGGGLVAFKPVQQYGGDCYEQPINGLSFLDFLAPDTYPEVGVPSPRQYTVTEEGRAAGLRETDINGYGTRNYFQGRCGMDVLTRQVETGTAVTLGTRKPLSTEGPQGADCFHLKVDDMEVPEGDAGTTRHELEVSLSEAADRDVTVGYETEEGTAKANQDYKPAKGTVDFK
jgi:alpha-tubulin suppressor-like RCC1 family protein/protocatechuate 3,4-dioxygenase beta subunit